MKLDQTDIRKILYAVLAGALMVFFFLIYVAWDNTNSHKVKKNEPDKVVSNNAEQTVKPEEVPTEKPVDPNALKAPVLLSTVFMSSERFCVAGLCEDGATVTIQGGREPVKVTAINGQFVAEVFVPDEPVLEVFAEKDGRDKSEAVEIDTYGMSRDGRPVYIGKDNQMIYKDTAGDAFGNNLFKDNELQHIKVKAEELQQKLKDAGLKTELIITVSPNPVTIYPELLSDYLAGRKESEDSRLQQLTKLFADSTVKFINPYDRMMEVRNDAFLYVKTDTHWNELGAYYAYAELFDYIGTKFPTAKTRPLSDFEIKTTSVRGGDICPMLEIDAGKYRENFTTLRIKNPTALKRDSLEVPYQESVYHQFTEYKNPDADKPSIIMYRDSYSIAMMSPIAETAGNVIFYNMWDYGFNMDYIKSINPDFIIVQKVERDLAVFLNIFG